MIIGRIVDGKFEKYYDSDENSAAVLYIKQNLTEDQKSQARENIGITGTGVVGITNITIKEV